MAISTTYTYDRLGKPDYSFTRGYADESYVFTDFDNLGNQPWSRMDVQYDSSNHEKVRSFTWEQPHQIPLAEGFGFDSLSYSLMYSDYAGTQSWSSYVWDYDLQGNLTRSTTNYDNGSWIVYDIDTVGNQPWTTWSEYYADQSHWTLVSAALRTGETENTYNDPFNIQPWSTTVYHYDSLNRLDWVKVNDDSGSSLLTGYDQANNQTESYFQRHWDTLGRWDWDLFYNDDGGKTFVDYNNGGSGAPSDWANVVYLYDPAGTLTNTFATYNSGIVVAEYLAIAQGGSRHRYRLTWQREGNPPVKARINSLYRSGKSKAWLNPRHRGVPPPRPL